LTQRPGLLARLLPDGEGKRGKAGVDLRPAWRRDDEAIARDAVEFWQRLGILPDGVRPEDRARILVGAAHEGDRLIGLSTAALARFDALGGRFAFYRCAVDPAHRRSGVATALTVYSRDLLGQWSADHPAEKVLGLIAIVDSAELAARQRSPVWPKSGLNLVAFTPQGRQIRVAWFAHAQID